MKRCPSCERLYADDAMSFCTEDGTLLVDSTDEAATMIIPPARVTNQAPTELMPELVPETTRASPVASPLQNIRAEIAPAERKKSALPWIGAALILGLSAIAVALIVTRSSGTDSAQTAQNAPGQLEAGPGNTSPPESSPTPSPQGREGTIQSPSSPESETSPQTKTGKT